ncbi:MAG: cyclic nucleotide-binding domain-containing protein [Proteobacteria bacterium]|nr:cyclic nucleotide-binding domain-containing protein [Pseudomonadota bacterium]
MQAATLAKYLQTHTILSALSAQQLAPLVAHSKEQHLSAGEVLFSQGDAAQHFYVLREGAVQIGVPAINGPALEVQALGADAVIGWSWLIPPYRWSFEAKAQSESSLVAFDGKPILQECEKDPALGYALMKIFAALMSQRLDAARLKMMDSWMPPGWA